MDAARRKRLARIVLAAFAVAAVARLATLDYRKKFSTDILDLVPANEGSPEVALVRNLATDLQARVMLFALRDPASPSAPPQAAAAVFAAALRKSPQFAEVVPLAGTSGEIAMGRYIFEHRAELLLPTWLGDRWRAYSSTHQPPSAFSPWLAERAASALEAFLSRPDAIAMERLIPRDPLLLTPNLIARVRGTALPGSGIGGYALVWARISASPFSEAGQRPVFDAIGAAAAQTRSVHPGAELRWSGINRFAAASRARIELEIRELNLVSIAAVFAVACLFVRRPWRILHLAPVVVLSLLGAWTACTLLFDRTLVLVFIIGALLCGVAIDYGFYIYMQPPLAAGEPYGAKIRRLLKPLLASCLTTVTGFCMLFFSGLPLIREVGVFVSAGLLCALGAAMLYFAQVDSPYLEARPLGRAAPAEAGPSSRARLWKRLILAVAALVVLVGPWRLRWRDDVRELEIPAPALEQNDQDLQHLFGQGEGATATITYGATPEEARQHLEDFLNYEASSPGHPAGVSMGLLFPTARDWRQLPARLRLLPGFADDFRAALRRHGFDPGAFEPFFSQWRSIREHPPVGDYASLYGGAAREITGPLALLYNIRGSVPWFITLLPSAPAADLPPSLHTIAVDKLRTLDRLFARYRWSAMRLSLVGLGLVIASVFAIYHPFRRALRIALIPSGSCFFVFGVFGLCGLTLNLFHLLGAFLGVCLAHNYAIFSAETSRAGQPPPPSIRLSALCAAASFGVLSLSHIPVVHALGMTVACIVLTALAYVELETASRTPGGRSVQPRPPS